MPEFVRQAVDVDGVRLNLWLGGSGDTTFMLVHGIGVSHRYFLPLARELGEYGQVMMVDLPGFAGTPTPDRPLCVEDFARLVLAAMEHARVPPAVVVGHSMGAQIAVEMARLQPGATGGIVLLGPVTDTSAPTAAGQGWRLLRDIAIEPMRCNAVVLSDYLRSGPFWYAKVLPSMLGYPIERRLQQVEVPVVVGRGGRDPVAPGHWSRQLADASGSRLAEVPDQPHVVMLTEPVKVAQWCRQVAAWR
jgi:pimeloyl-ACP methyl ester carboxylesterase